MTAALGFIAFDDPQAGHTWFKGHNEWTGNMVMCQDARRPLRRFYSNDVRAEPIYLELVDFIHGDSVMP